MAELVLNGEGGLRVSVIAARPGARYGTAKARRDLRSLHDRSTRLVAELTDLNHRWDQLQRRITTHLNR